jgi:uncharacterized membrane protein YphA (DoxX/SURF4 family)
MTNASVSQPKPSRFATVALWIVKILVAFAFAAAAFLKLSGDPKMVTEFGEIGFGQGFRYATGIIELVGAGLMLLPRTALVGALTLIGICAGALVAQLAVLHGDLIHVFVLGGLLVVIAVRSRTA